MGKGRKGPGPGGRDLNSVDPSSARRESGWRVGATAALSSSPSSRRRRVFSLRGLEGQGERGVEGRKNMGLAARRLGFMAPLQLCDFDKVTEPRFPFL